MTMVASQEKHADGPRRRRLQLQPVPAEGEGGLFTQTWYPICLSTQAVAGQVFGTGFLDGRVIVLRGEDGAPQVLSAYCPHMGADLSMGCVEANAIKCPFHHWKFNADGACVGTALDEKPPAHASLFRFPTAERHGLIWAFNGEEPLFDIPGFPELESQGDLEHRVMETESIVGVDPWVLASSTVDFQHLRAVHGMTFEPVDPCEVVQWTDYGCSYELSGKLADGAPFHGRYAAAGSNIYYSSGTFMGRWFGLVAPFGIPTPGTMRVFIVGFVKRSEGDAASNEAFLNGLMAYEAQLAREDAAVLKACHLRPGAMMRSDRALVAFLSYMRKYPRAHPSADYIR